MPTSYDPPKKNRHDEGLKDLIRKHTSGDPKREIKLGPNADATNLVSGALPANSLLKQKGVFQVIQRETGKVVGTYSTKLRAIHAMDKHDNNYGSYAHKIKEILQGD